MKVGYLLEITLQYQLRGYRIDVCFSASGVLPGGAQPFFGFGRGESLVGVVYAQPEAAAQLIGEAGTARGHGVWCAIKRQWQANNQSHRLPFDDKAGNRGKAFDISFAVDYGQRVSLPEQRLANGNADALLAEIEGEYGAGRASTGRHFRHARRSPQGW